MKKLINITMDIVSRLYHLVVIRAANVRDPGTKQNILKELAALQYAVSGMAIHLGFTPEQLTQTMAMLDKENRAKERAAEAASK